MPPDRVQPADEVALRPIIRAGWWMILLGAACGVGAGAWLAHAAGTRLTVTVEVLVKPLTRDPLSSTARPLDRVSMDNEARAVVSDVVLRRAQAALPNYPPLDELRRVTVEAFPGSTVMKISVTTAVADLSRDRAYAIATSYLTQRADDARRTNDTLSAEVREQLDEATADAQNSGGDDRLLVSRVTELQAKLDELDRFDPDPGTILRGPSAPEHSGPTAPLTALGAALVGMLLGLGAATLRARHIDLEQAAGAERG